MNSRNSNQMTPWQVFGVALYIVTFIILTLLWMDFTHDRDMQRLKYMEEHPAEVMQWLRDNEGR